MKLKRLVQMGRVYWVRHWLQKPRGTLPLKRARRENGFAHVGFLCSCGQLLPEVYGSTSNSAAVQCTSCRRVWQVPLPATPGGRCTCKDYKYRVERCPVHKNLVAS